MINDAQVFLAGYVATEPIFKQVGGSPTTKLRIGYTPRHLNRETGEWMDGPTSFVGVQCWRTLATNVAMCLRKGDPVLVRGRLQVRRYTNSQGEPRIAVEVDAHSVGHDLSRGVAHFSRTRRSPGETAAEMAESAAAAGNEAEGAAPEGPAAGEPAGVPVPGELAESGLPGDGPAAGTPGGGAPAGPADAGVADERAVEEFARELSESVAGEQEVSIPA